MAPLLNKPYENEVILREQKASLKYCQPLELFTYFEDDMGSVGQRAAKLLAVNVGGLKKKSAIRPRPHLSQSAKVRTRAQAKHSQSLMAGSFAAL